MDGSESNAPSGDEPGASDVTAFDVEAASGSRLARWRGLAGLGVRRVGRRLVGDFPNRTVLSVTIIAIAIALTFTVTGVSLGLATQSTILSEDVDYWIVPESGTTQSTLLSVEGPQLGDVHDRTASIRRLDGVRDATPVLIEVIRLRAERSDAPQYVLGVGVVPSAETGAIASVSTASLTPGDPYYADGGYDGQFTGEVVLSPGAADLLNASAGDSLTVGSLTTTEIRTAYTVTAVEQSAGPRTVQGELPVAVFHLSELQQLTGADVGDQADQVLVQTNSPGVKATLAETFDDATVVTRASLTARQLFDSRLPLALSIAAALIGFVVSTLFLATTMGLEVEADRPELGLLAALGFSTGARLALILTSTLVLALLGSVLGTLLGIAGIFVVNVVAVTQFGTGAVAVLHPLLPALAVAMAALVGVVAAPYPLALAVRSDALREVGR